VSPVLSAHENEKPGEYQPFASGKFYPAAIELTRGISAPEQESIEEADSPEVEIQAIFRRKLAGLRLLPRRERAQARRAALEWLWFAMAALREKRAHARHVPRRLQGPAPY
jgi:hypothetical protein